VRATAFETEGAARVDVHAEAMINEAYLRVIHTGRNTQIGVMTLPPDDETGDEVNEDLERVIVFVDGVGEARLGDYALGVRPGDLVFVEPGTRHNIINRATVPLRFITVFAPPVYPAGTVAWTRGTCAAAKASPEEITPSINRGPLRAGPRLVGPERTASAGS
jgi:mannose-6-phosphate isomerase-like protein (cupin superfamily)